MVTTEVRRSASGVTDALEDMNVTAIVTLMVLFSGGILLGQEISDRVLPRLNMPQDPTSASGLGAAMIVKVVGAMLLVLLASRMGGGMRWVAGSLAAGMLGLAGADLFNVLQRGGIPGTSTGGRVSAANSRSPRSRRTVSPAAGGGGGGGGSANRAYNY